MFTCIKTYSDIPFAHRQHLHSGHCAFIHGHNWSFTFEFGCKELDANGFVIDFGDLKWLKQWLEDKFDHKLVLNEDDPFLKHFALSLGEVDACPSGVRLADITTVPNCGAEGLASYVAGRIHPELRYKTADRVFLVSITVKEDSKNSATLYLKK